jgi:hypothetical protein
MLNVVSGIIFIAFARDSKGWKKLPSREACLLRWSTELLVSTGIPASLPASVAAPASLPAELPLDPDPDERVAPDATLPEATLPLFPLLPLAAMLPDALPDEEPEELPLL